MIVRSILLAGMALALTGGCLAGQPDGADDRLREALRATTVQLRNTQGELAVALADKQEAEEQVASLRRRLENLVRQSAEDQAAAQDILNETRARLEASEASAARLAESLLACQSALDGEREAHAAHRKAFAQVERSADELRREIALLRAQNRELYRIGIEILDRYEGFALGRAVAAREPFTGLARVRLQAQIQDYQDALDDHRIGAAAGETAPARAVD